MNGKLLDLDLMICFWILYLKQRQQKPKQTTMTILN